MKELHRSWHRIVSQAEPAAALGEDLPKSIRLPCCHHGAAARQHADPEQIEVLLLRFRRESRIL
eukprot:87690-Amphidinium_carterae.1